VDLVPGTLSKLPRAVGNRLRVLSRLSTSHDSLTVITTRKRMPMFGHISGGVSVV